MRLRPTESANTNAGPHRFVAWRFGFLGLAMQETIRGKNADFIYAGAAPGLQEAISQFSIRIPMDGPAGDAISLALTSNGVSRPTGSTASVKYF